MPRNKRSKTHATIGALTEDDTNPQRLMTADITSAAPSTREFSPAIVPSLTTLCTRKFAQSFIRLRNNERLWAHISGQLHIIPDPLIPKIFAVLRAHYPTYLKHELIVTCFFRGSSVTLTSALPGVHKRTITDIPRLNPNLVELVLDGFTTIADAAFASALRGLKSLQLVVLRGCTQVGSQTIEAATENCPSLRVVNLNYTSATPASVLEFLRSHPNVEVLKLAGLRNWTDGALARLINELDGTISFPNLHTLKLRQLTLSDASLSALIHSCPNLRRLDVAFTGIRHCASVLRLEASTMSHLEKLSIGSTGVQISELLATLPSLKSLRILSISALGEATTMTLTDDGLRSLTAVLESLVHIEDINLACNTKLCSDSVSAGSAMREFISQIGRNCKRLNLAGVSSLRSSDLEGLVADLFANEHPKLEVLNLSNTRVDDGISSFVSSCHLLKSLNLSGTKVTSDGVLPIIDVCPELTTLDLTSCRGIRVVDRRRFFEIWEEQRK